MDSNMDDGFKFDGDDSVTTPKDLPPLIAYDNCNIDSNSDWDENGEDDDNEDDEKRAFTNTAVKKECLNQGIQRFQIKI